MARFRSLLLLPTFFSTQPDGAAWPGWRDIVSAPTDGTIILVHVASRGMTLARHDIGRWWAIVLEDGVYGFSDEMIEVHPSHWMPLPDRPGRKGAFAVDRA